MVAPLRENLPLMGYAYLLAKSFLKANAALKMGGVMMWPFLALCEDNPEGGGR